MRRKVLVLGGSGMLGSMIVDYLSRQAGLQVRSTVRSAAARAHLSAAIPDADWSLLDVETASVPELRGLASGCDWVVNAIGVIKPYIHDDNAMETARALRVNALFPHLLGQVTDALGGRVIQIATDCVFSGKDGGYREPASHDALDVYGKTKSLGEAHMANVHHLRCSIIGPEWKAHVSLLDWFRRQPRGATVGGYTNHLWNGVTTLHFAKVCHGIIETDASLPHCQHLVPGDSVTKHTLLQCFAHSFARRDVSINATEAALAVDRTLGTENDVLNRSIWESAGHAQPPTVREMVEELAGFDYRPGDANEDTDHSGDTA